MPIFIRIEEQTNKQKLKKQTNKHQPHVPVIQGSLQARYEECTGGSKDIRKKFMVLRTISNMTLVGILYYKKQWNRSLKELSAKESLTYWSFTETFVS